MAIFENYFNICEQISFLKLSGFVRHHSLNCEIICGIPAGGVTNSIKDMVAFGMLKLAAEQGKLAPGQPVVDCTPGPFSYALTVAALSGGHPMHVILPKAVADIHGEPLRALGATVHIPQIGRDGMPHPSHREAVSIAHAINGYFVDYLNNDDNPEYHRRVTGPQVLNNVGTKFDFFVSTVDSGGALSGAAEFIKAWTNGILVVAAQLMENQIATHGSHDMQLIGLDGIPGNYNPYIVDEVMTVRSGVATQTARELLYTDNLAVTASSGCAIATVRELAQKPENAGKRFVVLLGEKRTIF